MPAIGAGGGIQRGASLPTSPPKPVPRQAPIAVAPTSLRTGANPRGVAIPARPAPATVNDRAARFAGTGANPRGVQITPRPSGGKGIHQAIRDVFNHQNPVGQAALIKGVLGGKADPGTAKAIRAAWNGLGVDQQIALTSRLPHPAGVDIGSALGAAAKGLYGLIAKPNNFRANATGNTPLGGEKALQAAAAATGGLIQKIPTKGATSTEQARIETQAGLGPGQLGKNFLQNAVDLPAEVGPSMGIPAAKLLTGDWRGALQYVTQPYAQMFGHGTKGLEKFVAADPLNAYLMTGGILHPTLRGAESVGRAAAGKGPVDLNAPSVALTGNLTHERPDFSAYPAIRHGQKVVAQTLYERDPASGLLIPKDAAIRNRLIKLETSRLVGQAERIRRPAHEAQLQAHAESVLKPRGERVAHAVKTAATHNPEPALVPGADVLSLIEQGVLRRPETAAADLAKHIGQVSATRPDLLGFPERLAQHDEYVKGLTDTLAKLPSAEKLAPAFKAAATYAKDYAGKGGLEKRALDLGHYRDMTPEALQRRTLFAAVKTHMPGARMDPELGMVQDVKGVPRPLSTAEMAKFVKGQTGRDVAFVSHKGPKGDSAHYVRQEIRPRVAAMNDTLYNFEHGLTDPSHNALLEARAHTQGIINAHHAVNRLDQQLVMAPGESGRLENAGPNTKGWNTYFEAQRDAPKGYVPIQLAQQFHPGASLARSLASDNVDMTPLQEEAALHGLDINARLTPSETQGRYGIIHQAAADQLRAHEALISPNSFFRTMRGLTGQFRRVALGTSFRHLPGIAQELAIRSAASGIGPISLLAGSAILKGAKELDPRIGAERQIQLTGGGQIGQALDLRTREVPAHFRGTLVEPVLRGWQNALRAPVLRQMSTLWRTWLKFTLNGTKHILADKTYTAAVGKQAINDFGGRHGVLAAAMGSWGKMIDQAARGVLDENTARRTGAWIGRVYGRWNDLTPTEQQILMFSPFGMWWTNSVAWLARFPIDHPVGAALQAALNQGTQQQREKLGLDMFSPNHLPLYKQGGIPIGGQLWGANYYSPAGVMGDPGETATSLILPWETELAAALGGRDWKGTPITSPTNPTGRNQPPFRDIATVLVNSLASNFIPLYQKAQTIMQGGASTYDTSTFLHPQTKGPNPGPLQGLKKAVMPIRLGRATAGAAGGTATGTSNGGWKLAPETPTTGGGAWKIVP